MADKSKGISWKVAILIACLLLGLSFYSYNLGYNKGEDDCFKAVTTKESVESELAQPIKHMMIGGAQYIPTYPSDIDYECIQWTNKTKINPEYLDNCCVKNSVSLEPAESDNTALSVGNSSFNVKITNSGDGYYQAGLMCIGANSSVWTSIAIGNNSINVSKCENTPKEVSTGERICAVKKLIGWNPEPVRTYFEKNVTISYHNEDKR